LQPLFELRIERLRGVKGKPGSDIAKDGNRKKKFFEKYVKRKGQRMPELKTRKLGDQAS
jgi:hypothetical protein